MTDTETDNMMFHSNSINQQQLDALIQMAMPETDKRRMQRKIAQDSLGLYYDKGLIALDKNLDWYIVERSVGS